MRKVVVVGGVPGTGKSTLVRTLLQEIGGFERAKPAKLVDCEYNQEKDIYVLGKYDEGEIFPGCDRLSMSCQPNVLEFIESKPDSVFIVEGDRLFNRSFIDAVNKMPNTKLKLIVLTVSNQAILKGRYELRGSDQDEQFLRSRRTKVSNILENMDYMGLLENLRNDNEEQQTVIKKNILEFIEK